LDFPPGLIEFRGLLEGTPLVKSYQECDFLLMFSNYENMPVVISEAFSCGKPVLATRVGGIPEYITPQSGRLVNAADEQALYTTLNEMLDTCRSFDGVWIRNIALENFSVEAVERQLQHLYSFASGVEGEAKS
jgi:glycosyltransferase involved in cell wall biosynthesis